MNNALGPISAQLGLGKAPEPLDSAKDHAGDGVHLMDGQIRFNTTKKTTKNYKI